MINPFNYVPVKEKKNDSWHYASAENQWGIYWYKSQFKRVVLSPTTLIEKGLYSRIQRFTAPIPLMAKYNEERLKIDSQISQAVKNQISNPQTVHDVKIPEEYESLLKQVKLEWKNRMSAGGGGMLFQYNAKTGIIISKDIRQVAVIANEITGEASSQNIEKISWLEYFYLGFKTTSVRVLCAIHNFRHRKEIAIELAAQKAQYNAWHDEVFKDLKNEQ